LESLSGLFDERAAASYESWYETPEGTRADALEKAALRRLMEGFSAAQSVLEVGCGTGHFTRWLRDLGWRALGLDLSAPMLAEARALDGVPLVRGDAARLPFADGAFDVVSFITTLEFLEHPDAALAEAVRVAQEGLLLGVLNRWSILGLRRRLAGLFRPTIYDQARFYGVKGLEQELRAVVDGAGRTVWRTTLFPFWARCLRRWPGLQAHLPWGGFIAMALHQTRQAETP
jgi:SAM-dependent methyltransferase